MATKTKKRPTKRTKKATRRRITHRRAPAASTNGKGPARTKTAPPDKFADNQPTLPAMEDTNERIPALDEACQLYFSAHDNIRSNREKSEEALGAVGELLHEHELLCYIKNGKKFYIEPGKEAVKVKKVRQQ